MGRDDIEFYSSKYDLFAYLTYGTEKGKLWVVEGMCDFIRIRNGNNVCNPPLRRETLNCRFSGIELRHEASSHTWCYESGGWGADSGAYEGSSQMELYMIVLEINCVLSGERACNSSE